MPQLYIPNIEYKDWLEVSKSNSKNPNIGTFKASKTTSKRNSPIKSEDPLYRLLGSDKGLQKSTMESILKAAKKFATRLGDLQGKGSFLKKEADNGPKKEYSDDQLYFSIFLIIQMWGGQTGRGALTSYPGKEKDADIIRKAEEDGLIPDPNIRSTYVGGGEGYNKWKENPKNADKGEKPLVAVEYSKYWLPTYKKAVELTKEGKFGEALETFSKIPQLDISFGSKHLWFWGQVFNSIKKYNKVPHVYDTRIARMLFGKSADAEDYDAADKAYEDIIKQKRLSNFSSSDVEQALFAFSNCFFNNELTVWEYNPEEQPADEASIKEAKNIFCKRNGNKCKDGELLPTATQSTAPDNNNRTPGNRMGYNINGISVKDLEVAAQELSDEKSVDTKEKYKKLYDTIKNIDIETDERLAKSVRRKGYIKTIQDAYKKSPEELEADRIAKEKSDKEAADKAAQNDRDQKERAFYNRANQEAASMSKSIMKQATDDIIPVEILNVLKDPTASNNKKNRYRQQKDGYHDRVMARFRELEDEKIKELINQYREEEKNKINETWNKWAKWATQ
jgi:hypothetical protein